MQVSAMSRMLQADISGDSAKLDDGSALNGRNLGQCPKASQDLGRAISPLYRVQKAGAVRIDQVPIERRDRETDSHF